jgi:hypothetical protein
LIWCLFGSCDLVLGIYKNVPYATILPRIYSHSHSDNGRLPADTSVAALPETAFSEKKNFLKGTLAGALNHLTSQA